MMERREVGEVNETWRSGENEKGKTWLRNNGGKKQWFSLNEKTISVKRLHEDMQQLTFFKEEHGHLIRHLKGENSDTSPLRLRINYSLTISNWHLLSIATNRRRKLWKRTVGIKTKMDEAQFTPMICNAISCDCNHLQTESRSAPTCSRSI